MGASYKKYEKLRNKRKESNYRVSMETGIAQTTLSDWKLGKSDMNRLDHVLTLAKHFGVDVKDLV